MRFSDYHITDEIKRGLDKLGFKKPTDIQFKAIPGILNGEDVLAIAQTGTGKTAAYAIPILNILQTKRNNRRTDGIKCIVLVPTRELASQINAVFEEIGRYSRVRSFALIGGVDQDPQIAKLDKGVEILVATPGRMFDLVSQGHLRLDRIEIVVLDEADLMLDLGFIKDIQDLIYRLPKKRQTLFISATINPTIKKLAYSLVNKPLRIQLSPKDPVSKNVTHSVTFIEMDDKRFFLERLIRENPEQKILVFVRTKVRAERVQKAMDRVDIKSEIIHGGKDQSDRFKTLNAFKEGVFNVLVATDVSARGIDIPGITYVVNYDLPDKSENYVHRVGRTGRGRNKGTAISFCSKEELPILKEIESFIHNPIEVLTINTGTYQETLYSSEKGTDNWQLLIENDKQFEEAMKKKKRKKK